jgi:hypothetical protein
MYGGDGAFSISPSQLASIVLHASGVVRLIGTLAGVAHRAVLWGWHCCAYRHHHVQRNLVWRQLLAAPASLQMLACHPSAVQHMWLLRVTGW